MKVKTIFFDNTKCYLVTTDDGIPITDVCKYLKSLRLMNFSDSTVASKAYDLALYFEYLEEFKLNHLNVTEDNLNDFIYSLYSSKLKTFKRIKNITTTLNNFYEFISKNNENEVDVNKIKEFHINITKKYIPKNKEIHIINDIEPICKLTNNIRDELLVRILFETGARGSEIINLTIDDLVYFDKNSGYCLKDFKSSCSSQSECYTCSHSHYGYFIKIPSSKIKFNNEPYRIVPISEKLASLILDYDKKILMNIKSENKFIFIQLNGTNIGKKLSYSYISTCLKSLCKKSELNITPLSLRRSFIVNALSKYNLQSVSYVAGLTSPLSSYNYLSKLRGHEPISSVYNYINPDDMDRDKFIDKVNNIIKEL